ncbi:Amino-acid carrier protein AlsT [Sporomusa ovata DSM 2662]|uniref:Sodium/glycine symporter GlyP n=1 Tax=Sporomusa ovata TaxID=2378 RepID=A0A0U1KZ36_9FIRM|nr:alanine/glycine:cation symporter family protein [Sporomusa ovata]EQB27753.1 amino acid carrier protein [Sporomusa ovata DSM 2662]CQR72680.1 Sodium/glycine symporter GlyP [Sporomusa ovata]
MQGFHDLINWANGYLWGPPMLILLFGTHLFLTYRLRFIQKYVWKAIKLSVSKDRSGEGDVSQFGALTTALAATIGTGNIVGVATAVGLGGPGAVLWCWLTGVFGMATKYAEALLSVRYRVKTSDGTMLGGPMYALENGLNMKWLAVLFCVFTSIAAFGIGNMVQANSISAMMQETMGVSPYLSGGVLAVLTAVVILGGVKSIASVCEKLVPFMAIFYVFGCAIILGMNASYLPATISLIVEAAFTPQAAGGGFVGASVMMAMRYGVARGLFSNESGLGSAPIVAAAAQTRNPVRQGLVSMTGTFWDTVVVCAMTGLVLVSSVIENPTALNQLSGAALTKAAFAQIPVVGPIVLSIGLLTFVFSTILGWSYYGERAMEYLFGKKSITPYRVVWVIAVFLGSVTSLTLVWDLADAMNALMAIPNLVSLIALSGVIVADTKKYLWEEGGLEREAPEQYSRKITKKG